MEILMAIIKFSTEGLENKDASHIKYSKKIRR